MEVQVLSRAQIVFSALALVRKMQTCKILSKRNVRKFVGKNQKPYPFPVSFIPHFLVGSNLNIQRPTGVDVLESGIFTKKSKDLNNSHVKEIIEIGSKELNRIS